MPLRLLKTSNTVWVLPHPPGWNPAVLHDHAPMGAPYRIGL